MIYKIKKGLKKVCTIRHITTVPTVLRIHFSLDTSCKKMDPDPGHEHFLKIY